MPYLRNTWYAGALATEVSSTPLARVLLDEPVVFFRTGDGAPVALADRCPHRFVPLSRGRVKGNDVECGYHGLRFGRDGACTLNPHGKKIVPGAAHVRSYPLVERFGFVWFWPGDPSAADPGLLPDFGFLEDTQRFTCIRGLTPIAGNYQLVVDNLLDLSHVEFLHPLLGQSEGVDAHRTEFFQEGNTVFANRWKPNSLIHGLAKKFFWNSPSPRGDARSNMRWDPPSTLTFDLGVTEVGATVEEGVCIWNPHMPTPETEFTTHYFWLIARNRRLEDAEVSRSLFETVDNIFRTEDGPMIELQQRAMGNVSDLLALQPVMLEPDAPAVRARRTLAALIEEEQAIPAKRPALHGLARN